MTDRTSDYFTMTGEHYEDGRFAFTSTRTLAGRYGGDLDVSLPTTAHQKREASRDALYALIATMPVEWAGKVERAANDLAVSEWSLALANVLRGFTSDVGEPSVIYLERAAGVAEKVVPPVAQPNRVDVQKGLPPVANLSPTGETEPPRLTDRTRRRVWRVTAGLVAALAGGMLIGRGWRR
jgi:hypothetical protein